MQRIEIRPRFWVRASGRVGLEDCLAAGTRSHSCKSERRLRLRCRRCSASVSLMMSRRLAGVWFTKVFIVRLMATVMLISRMINPGDERWVQGSDGPGK